MKYFAVIDTNIIVSALLKENSLPSKVLQLLIDGTIIPVFDMDILGEYTSVLKREKFGFDQKKIELLISFIKDIGITIKRINLNIFMTDKSDIKFYQVVMTMRKFTKAYLITGNTKHFPKRNFIITARQMIEIINDED